MASTTIYGGVKITWLGHASVLLEGDGLAFYVDPFLVPKGARPADAILYTHSHHDHCVQAPSITTNKTVQIGYNCKIPARVVQIGAKEKIGGVIVEAVHAYNVSKDFHPKGFGAGYILRFRGVSVYVAGDTDLIPEMKDYKCDVALVPIGGTYTMGPQEAAEAVALILPKVAIPVHYNYLSGTMADPQAFRRAVEARTGRDVDVRILTPML